MLLNDFFTITELNADAETLTAKIALNVKHRIYDGHFPDNPVTPGVVQMQIVKEILETHFKKPLQLKTMSKCKFLQILNPETTPAISIIIDFIVDDNAIKINATGLFEEVSYFKFSAIYQS